MQEAAVPHGGRVRLLLTGAGAVAGARVAARRARTDRALARRRRRAGRQRRARARRGAVAGLAGRGSPRLPQQTPLTQLPLVHWLAPPQATPARLLGDAGPGGGGVAGAVEVRVRAVRVRVAVGPARGGAGADVVAAGGGGGLGAGACPGAERLRLERRSGARRRRNALDGGRALRAAAGAVAGAGVAAGRGSRRTGPSAPACRRRGACTCPAWRRCRSGRCGRSALPQQTPLTQLPLMHWLAAVHTWPLGLSAQLFGAVP